MIRNISPYVKNILQNMRDAEEFIQGLSYDGFVADKRTFNAVVRSLEVIGEAVWIAAKDRIPAVRPLIEQILQDWETR
jgi:uncharacterized protein with HEPN domain